MNYPEITFSGTPARLFIHLDGKHYTRHQLATLLDSTNSSIYRGLKDKSSEDRAEWIRDAIWRKTNNQHGNDIYKRDGERFTGDMVVETTGLLIPGAHKRCHRWVKGEITTKQLLKKSDRKIDNCRNYSKAPAGLLDGMQPRRPVSFLGKPGTWESKHCPDPLDGCGSGTLGRGGGRTSKGSYYMGE